MAQELARSVEVLAAAIDAIPSEQLDQASIDQLVASVNASLAELRRIPSGRRPVWGGGAS